MNIKKLFTFKQLFQVFLVIMLGLFCYKYSGNIVSIDDGPTPLSGGNVEAMFYIDNPETGSLTCIGDGLLNSACEIVGNANLVSNAIVTYPDYSAYISSKNTIIWETILCSDSEYRVIGSINCVNHRNTISIIDYGAVGDGVTDNYHAIQTAIEAAIASSQSLEVPAGIYYVSKNLVIPGSIHIKGAGSSSSIIIFKDAPSNSDYPSYLQRGIISFKGNGLTVEDICFKYEADNYTPYSREAGQSGNDGVLFFLADVSYVNFKNTEVTVTGENNPSITCVWAKSETTSMDNITFESCIFNNYSEATAGGCLWISGHDNKNTTVSNALVKNCTFTKCGHDEAFGLWGHNVKDCSLLDSEFNYIGKTNNIQTVVSLGNTNLEDYLNNVTVSGNTFHLSGEVRNAIGVQLLSDDSNINIYNNSINGNFSLDKSFVCFALTKCGISNIYDNTTEITGGNNISFITFDKGGVSNLTNNKLTISGCNSWVLIKSKYSADFIGNINISDSIFNISANNIAKGQPTIQFPLNGKLLINNTSIDTSKSNIHEIVVQTLTKQNINENDLNPIELTNINTNANIIFNINKSFDRTIKLDNIQTPNIYYSFSNNGKLDEVQMSECIYNNFYINYQKSTPNNLKPYVNSLTLK